MTANLLAAETSPYLLQHKDNPVHWMPWGDAALAQASELDRPILLSVGYAACHWCHVMAHESFEDAETAALMNAHFISIKVDREERPDIDRIYMQALHALGEQGGWPLTMFLTPQGEPFWGGTYFPPEHRYGRPSFRHVLGEIARIWRDDRSKVTVNSKALIDTLNFRAEREDATLDDSILQRAANAFLRAVDREHGGLQGAPKFPQGPLFDFLWTMSQRVPSEPLAQVVIVTLRNICQGGIYDHLGGGIARYSVDGRWLVPHFEKMLYDNAEFLALLSRVWSRTHDDLFRIRAEETVEFLLRDMRTAGGAFAASYDADSEGEEGRFYIWTVDEIRRLLDAGEADLFCEMYDIRTEGNWEGNTILNRLGAMDLRPPDIEARLTTARQMLLAARAVRQPPGFDDKVLADWNGLAIAALATAALVFNRAEWRDAAASAFEIAMRLLWTGDNLHHSWRLGKTRHHATADGYANMISAALALYALTADEDYLQWAERLTAALERLHRDPESGAYYFASSSATDVIVRQIVGQDDATPNANGVMLGNLARLHLLTGKTEYLHRAEALHKAFAGQALANPFGFCSLFSGFLALSDPVQIALTGVGIKAPEHPLLRPAIERLGPDVIISYATNPSALPENHPAYLKATAATAPRLYLCRGQTCAAPVESESQLSQAMTVLGLVH